MVELEFAPRSSTGSLIPVTTPPPPPRGFWVSELKEGASLYEIKNTNRGTGIRGERDKFGLGCGEFEMLLGYHRYSVEQRVNETGA